MVSESWRGRSWRISRCLSLHSAVVPANAGDDEAEFGNADYCGSRDATIHSAANSATQPMTRPNTKARTMRQRLRRQMIRTSCRSSSDCASASSASARSRSTSRLAT